VNYSILEGLHGRSVLLAPNEGLILAGEVVEGAGDRGIVLDPYTHIACDAKKATDVGDILAWGPVMDLSCLEVVWDTAFVSTLVAQNDHLGDCHEQFACRDSGAGASEAVENAVNIIQVLPNESVDKRVSGNGFIPAVRRLISSSRAFDAAVIYEWPSHVWNFRL
jgi:hypothetical protein